MKDLSQGVLCLWLHASCLCNSDYCYHLRDNCGDIFLAECGELPLAVDFILLCSFNCFICILLLSILLSCQD